MGLPDVSTQNETEYTALVNNIVSECNANNNM